MRHAVALRRADVGEDRAGAPRGFRRIFQFEAFQRAQAKLVEKQLARIFLVKLIARPFGKPHGLELRPQRSKHFGIGAFGKQRLDRRHAGQLVAQGLRGGMIQLCRQQFPRRHIGQRQPRRRPVDKKRRQIIVRRCIEQIGLEHGARRDRAGDGAPHHALGLPGIFHLVADRDGPPRLNHPREVAVNGAHRHPGHRDARVFFRAVARRERQPEQFGGFNRVFEEELVEIAHPEEQQRIPALRFGFEVLAQHGRQLAL
ncbi:MAG: hypothetical protein BWY59_00619 [Verrucomicrobia bacterium ADurb.Bin345]|nr:MAG: hypothetical protein BWY59_00619 [Verrucomicrobia bacterium ADurb.Bin345]